jgi:hypothetical protein
MRKCLSGWAYSGCVALSLTAVACGGEPGVDESAGVGPTVDTTADVGEAIVNIPGVGPQRVNYVMHNGVAYHAGDIEIPPEDLAALADPRTTSAGIMGEYYRWPNGRVPIQIDASAAGMAGTIQAALNTWATATADGAGTPMLSFPTYDPANPEPHVQFVRDDSIPGSGSSPIGRSSSGVNTIRLKGASTTTRTVLHEFGHSLGLYHEHQRYDRNNSLIVWDGTNGHANRLASSFVSDFKKYTDGIDLAPGLDFASIMMYPSSSNACSVSPCLTKLDGVTTWRQASTLSPGDADGIRRLYLQIAFGKISFYDFQTPLKNITLVTPQDAVASGPHTLALRPADKHLVHYPLSGDAEDFGLVATSGVPGRFAAVAGATGRFDWVSVTGAKTIVHGWRSGATTSYETLASGSSTVGASLARQALSSQIDAFAVFGSPPRIYMKSYIAGNWTGQCLTQAECVDGWHVTRPTSGTIIGGQIASVSAPDPNNKRLDIVAATTLGVEHIYWTSVTGWQGPITIASNAGGALTITAVGGDRHVFHQTSTGTIFRTSFEGTWGGPVRIAGGTDPTELSAASRSVAGEMLVDLTYHLSGPGVWEQDTYRR